MNGRHTILNRRAVLWDVDGTLVDSLEYHWASWEAALRAEAYELSREQFLSTFGRRNDEILRAYFGPDISAEFIERVSLGKEDRYRELVRHQGIEPLPGVRRWLEELSAAGWLQAVASSAPPLNLEVILAALHLSTFFDAVVSAEEVRNGKPDPEIFLTAAEKLQTSPPWCVVVEDAPAGIEAAHRAGMRAVGVLTTHSALEADLVVQTLEDLEPNAFARLLAPEG